MDNNSFLIIRTDDAQDLPLPSRKSEGASGLDLYANVTRPITLFTGGYSPIPTGIKLVIPKNHEVQIRGRSGLAAKHGVGIVNGPGTIDEDFRGELKAIVINHGRDPFVINRGDRIAQIVLCPVSSMNPVEVTQETFDMYSTERGEGELGSTGVK